VGGGDGGFGAWWRASRDMSEGGRQARQWARHHLVIMPAWNHFFGLKLLRLPSVAEG